MSALRVVGLGAAVLALLGVGALTRFPHAVAAPTGAELRLAWRARAPLVEECRRLSDAELEALPVHMRREVVCEGRVASYRLVVTVDGVVRHEAVVRGAGARGDRPLYVFESLPVDPGAREVDVRFERIGTSNGVDGGGLPDRLELVDVVELAPGAVGLVTYDGAERRLALRLADPEGGED